MLVRKELKHDVPDKCYIEIVFLVDIGLVYVALIGFDIVYLKTLKCNPNS
jgi:glutathionyl-hydroquinone reductase